MFNSAVFMFSFFLLCFLAPGLASAHMLKTDGSIGAIIHVDPDDDPYVGVSSNIFFELKDKNGKFTQEFCQCVVEILKGEQTLDSFLLFESGDADLDHPSTSYTFPEKGIYTIKLTGTPKQAGQFEPFILRYDIRVARETEQKDPENSDSGEFIPNQKSIMGIVILIIGGFIIGGFVISRLKKKGQT